MLTYTNHLKRLVLPEYGRNIQRMVDHCMTIENRDERNLCANSIIDTMLTLFPGTGDAEEYRRKLWDHLLIMSDFKLDVDFPFEHVDPAVFADRPDAVPAERPGTMPYSHYGNHIPRLVDAASSMPEGEERDALIFMVACQIKKTLTANSNDAIEDARVFAEIRRLSHGALDIAAEDFPLEDYKAAPVAAGKKKKKR